MDLRAHGEHAWMRCSARRSFSNHLQQAFGRSDRVGFLTNFPTALRMCDDSYARIPGANVIDVLGQEALVDGAVSFPEDYFCGAKAVGRQAAIDQVGIPNDHFV